jgi:hypothetical protein
MSNQLITKAKFLALCCLCGMVGLRSRVAAGADWNAGFLSDQYSLTLEPGQRTEALGPLFYSQERDTERTWAVPPLFSRTLDDATDVEEIDFLYPLLTYDRFGKEYRWQLFQLLSFAGGQSQNEEMSRRFTVFPLYFQQRSQIPSKNYTALFPIYGNLQNRLFRSEISFALWPIYVKTVRRPSASSLPDDPFLQLSNRYLSARRGDITTYNYFFPIFHLRYGNGLSGWQLWPLVGQEQKQVTQVTNSWGDLEMVPGLKKQFVLWPFWFDEHRDIGSENPEHAQGLVPFYNFLRSPQRDSTSYLWPLGVTVTDDRLRQYHEIDAPWPIVVFAHGEGKTTHRILPFFSLASSTNLVSNSYLWPLYKYNRVQSGTLDLERRRIFFFLYVGVNEYNTETGAARKRNDFWPLFVHRRDFNGNTRFQLLAPIESVLASSKSIERNWSPLTAVWRAEKNPETGGASQSLLWNLYRRETSPTAKKCSLLFGLFQYQSDAEAGRWRVFYLPLTKSQKDSKHVSEHR